MWDCHGKSQVRHLEIPGLERVSPSFEADGLTISYALFKGNIVYIYLDNCRLSNYLIPEDFAKMQDMQGINLKVSQQVKEVWTKWFDKIQQLHAAGTLGGVVIDVLLSPSWYSPTVIQPVWQRLWHVEPSSCPMAVL